MQDSPASACITVTRRACENLRCWAVTPVIDYAGLGAVPEFAFSWLFMQCWGCWSRDHALQSIGLNQACFSDYSVCRNHLGMLAQHRIWFSWPGPEILFLMSARGYQYTWSIDHTLKSPLSSEEAWGKSERLEGCLTRGYLKSYTIQYLWDNFILVNS